MGVSRFAIGTRIPDLKASIEEIDLILLKAHHLIGSRPLGDHNAGHVCQIHADSSGSLKVIYFLLGRKDAHCTRILFRGDPDFLVLSLAERITLGPALFPRITKELPKEK